MGAVVGASRPAARACSCSRPRSSASPSTRRCCRRSWSLPAFIVVYLVAGKPQLLASASRQLAAALVALSCRRAGGSRSSRCGRRRPGPTSAAPATTPSSAWCSATTACRASSAASGPAGGGAAAVAPVAVAGFGGSPGCSAMFNLANGGQISWLLPLAAGRPRRRAVARPGAAPRTDLARAGWLLWGGWALVCVAVFSLSTGHLPPVLQRAARAGRRRARRRRWRGAVEARRPAAVAALACSRPRSSSPRRGPSCSSTARPTTTRGSAP